jgi:hypothetical protein
MSADPERIDFNRPLPATFYYQTTRRRIAVMRPVSFGEALLAGTRLALFSDDKAGRFFTVIKFWMDETSGVALALRGGVPTYQVEDEEGRTHLLIHLPIEEEHEDRWCLWRAPIMSDLIPGVFLRTRS